MLVRLEEPKKTVLPSLTAPEEEGEKAVEARDEAFRDFIKETLGTGLFSSIQITGYGFSPDWAKMSIGSLCMQRRKVYYKLEILLQIVLEIIFLQKVHVQLERSALRIRS